MASVYDVKLVLDKHDHKKKTAKVTVTYKVRLSCVERKMKCLRFKETIGLWGDDPSVDDWLYNFSTRYFYTEEDGTVTRSRTATLADDILDEDPGVWFINPTDEVYAKVCVTPLLPSKSCRNSNVIKHKF